MPRDQSPADMATRVGVYLGSRPESGGSYQYSLSVLHAASHLDRTKFEVLALYGDARWERHVEDGVAVLRVPHGSTDRVVSAIVKRLPAALARRLFLDIHPIGRVLRRHGVDVLVCPSEGDLTYLCPLRSIGTIFDLMHRYERRFPEVSAGGEYRRRERRYRRMVRYASLLFVDSETGKRQVLESYAANADKVVVLPYVLPATFSAVPSADVDTRFNLPARFLYYPAQFWLHKNHLNLVHAVSRLVPELPDLHVVFSGSPLNAYDRVVRAIDELKLRDRMRVLGYVSEEEKAGLYRRAVALVMPTAFGPTNIPPLEAMALGCPVVCSDVYGMRDQLGDAALYCDPESAGSIAEAIRRVWTDDGLRRILVARGYERARRWTQEDFNARFAEAVARAAAETARQ